MFKFSKILKDCFTSADRNQFKFSRTELKSIRCQYSKVDGKNPTVTLKIIVESSRRVSKSRMYDINEPPVTSFRNPPNPLIKLKRVKYMEFI